MVLIYSFRPLLILVLLNMILYGLQQPLNGGILQLVLDGCHPLTGAHLELLGYQVALIKLNHSLIVLLYNLLDDLLRQFHLILQLLI